MGLRGYKLVSTIVWPHVAILRRDKVQYQYAMFQTISPFFFVDSEFEANYTPFARQGFRVSGYLLLYGFCETPGINIGCEYKRQYMVEREKLVDNLIDYYLAFEIPTFRHQKAEASLTEQLKSYFAEGLYPTDIITKFQVLMQRPTRQNRFIASEYDLQVITKDLQNTIGELAGQGYRLAAQPNEIAVMLRKKGQTTPVSYIWLDWKKKDIEHELTTLQEQGAIYRTCYPNFGGRVTKMIFELPSVNSEERREYKVLSIQVQRTDNITDQKVEFDLTPASKETM